MGSGGGGVRLSFLGNLTTVLMRPMTKPKQTDGSIASPKCVQGEIIQFLHVFIYLFIRLMFLIKKKNYKY
jgi:hypothetical protein